MDKNLAEFLAQAKALQLTAEEKQTCRNHLKNHIHVFQHTSVLALTSEEKANARTTLLNFMQEHPRTNSVMESGFLNIFLNSFFRFPALAFALVILLIGGAGATYAAEAALPGDTFYPLKLHILEPLQERLVRSPAKRKILQTQRVERRLKEAHSLANKGMLTSKHRMMLEQNIVLHLQKIQEQSPIPAEKSPPETTQKLRMIPQRSPSSENEIQDLLATYEHALSPPPSANREVREETRHMVRFLRQRRQALEGQTPHPSKLLHKKENPFSSPTVPTRNNPDREKQIFNQSSSIILPLSPPSVSPSSKHPVEQKLKELQNADAAPYKELPQPASSAPLFEISPMPEDPSFIPLKVPENKQHKDRIKKTLEVD